MNKQLKEALRRNVSDNIILQLEYQRQPNTCVIIEVQFNDEASLFGVGFSKVRWPDKWDESYGVELAKDKAVMDVVRQLAAEARGD